MSRRAAQVFLVAVCVWIGAVALGAVALTLLGVTWSLAFGALISALLGLLWLAAWGVHLLWG